MNKRALIAGMGLIVGLALFGAALMFWKRSQTAGEASHAMEPPEFVDVVRAKTISWQRTARLVGTASAIRSVTIANEIPGVVTEVGFDSGDAVAPGQVIVRLDASTEEAELAGAEAAERLAEASIGVAEASIRAAESNVGLAEIVLRRMREAVESKSIAAVDVDRAAADLDKANADLARERASKEKAVAEREQTRARARQIRTIIEKKTIRAPFAARAGMRMVHPGQFLAEGTSVVGLSEVTDDIYLDFAVPQEYAARVAPGAEVLVHSSLLGAGPTPIRVVSVDATVNPSTRNVRVRGSVANPGGRLKPGMSIDVEAPIEAPGEFVAAPPTAVRRAAFGDHVFVLAPADAEHDPPGAFRAQQRMVEVGPDVGGLVIIASGLAAGERIAASGSFKLRDGALVFEAPAGGTARTPEPEGAP